MIRNETFVNGSCVKSDIIDLENGIVTLEENGVIVGQRPINSDEIEQFKQHPLSDLGALATLLAVESVLTVQDAANAVGLTPEDLINEAEAWSVGNP
jgi:hypothetical protein